MGNISNRMNTAGQSVDQLMDGLNVTGKAKTEKPLFAPSDNVYIPNMPQLGYQVPYPPVETARPRKAKTAESAPRQIVDIEIIGPEKFVFAGANGKLQIRIDQAVIDLYERQNDKKSQLVQAALVEYAQRHKLA